MAYLNGTLSRETFLGMPAHAPLARPTNHAVFTDTSILMIRYVSDGTTIAPILPADLEVEEAPIVTLQFYQYGASSIGTYRELIQMVDVRLKGEIYSFIPHIYLTNEAAMTGGREWLGYPKKLAAIDFDPRRVGSDATSKASLSRPADLPLVNCLFVPGMFEGAMPADGLTMRMLNHKIIPSAVVGDPASISELVPVDFKVTDGEKWAGTASLKYTGASDFDPLHLMPVVKMQDAMLIRKAKLELTGPQDAASVTAI